MMNTQQDQALQNLLAMRTENPIMGQAPQAQSVLPNNMGSDVQNYLATQRVGRKPRKAKPIQLQAPSVEEQIISTLTPDQLNTIQGIIGGGTTSYNSYGR